MSSHACAAMLLAALALAACSASPDNPVNQTSPIRSMDNFFRSLHGQPPPPSKPAYEERPGYAPAYPPYQP